ncbi:uncharacterized protein LOC141629079 [Silene latifolia]|uniref:uncharacterized protein LOC141629079 n=1 Tax=Silene latifolia TaxID=37657 RepID=UPI003D76FD4A
MTIAKNSAISSSSSPKNQKNSSNNKFDLLSSTTQEEFPALARKEGPSDADVQKEKAMGTIVGIPPLSLEPLVEYVELNYWRNSVYCFILGANPPWEIVEGFIRRLRVNYQPLIVKPWTPDVELIKHEVKSVPVWVKLHQLPLKFWGKGIPKIAGLLGNYIKCDPATEEKTRIGYARVMIEVSFGSALPDKVRFLDEHGDMVEVEVEYEWKPVACDVCHGVGHLSADCRKAHKKKTQAPLPTQKPAAKIWRPKAVGISKSQQDKGKAKVTSPVVVTHSGPTVEIQLQTPVVWHRTGTYSSGSTPIRPIMRMSRQETTEGACSVHTFGQQTFLEALNKSNTPKVGIGTSGSVPHLVVGNVDFCDYSAQCINMRILEIGTGKIFFLSMVYGFNDIIARQELWEQLVQFASTVDGPWLACGDFNTVLSHTERLGGSCSDAEIDDFHDCLSKCGLVDSPAMGSLFTWNNKQDVTTRVYSRLDRALINGEWGHQMPDMFARFLPEGDFDHTPCIMKCRNQHMHHKKPFKYYNMWGKASQYHNSISTWWNMYFKGTKMFCLVAKLK